MEVWARNCVLPNNHTKPYAYAHTISVPKLEEIASFPTVSVPDFLRTRWIVGNVWKNIRHLNWEVTRAWGEIGTGCRAAATYGSMNLLPIVHWLHAWHVRGLKKFKNPSVSTVKEFFYFYGNDESECFHCWGNSIFFAVFADHNNLP